MLIKELAARDAAETLAAYWDDRFPVDPFLIAERMGIRATSVVLDGEVSGLIVAQPQTQATILVEARDTLPRQRFTCAHEIGHYVERSQSQKNLEEGFSFVDARSSKRDAHEFYADEFAGNLLMPENEVRRLEAAGVGLVGMAGHFRVSVPAMEVRLRRLEIELIPAAW